MGSQAGGLCPHALVFQTCIYVCLHTRVGYRYLPSARCVMCALCVCIYTRAWYLLLLLLLLHLHSEWNSFSPQNDLVMLIMPPASTACVFEKSLPGSKAHLLTDFPACFLAVGSQPIKEPAGAFKPWTNTGWRRRVHFIPVRVPRRSLPTPEPIIFERIRSHRGDPLVQLSLKLVAHLLKWCGQLV